MTTKAQSPSAAAVPAGGVPPCDPRFTPPLTTEDRLAHIRVLGQRVDCYIQFMCQVGSLNGTSAEAKERAVTAFYERMVVVEGQLGRIQENLRLG